MMLLLDNTVLSNFAMVGRIELLTVALVSQVATTPQVIDEFSEGITTGLVPETRWNWLVLLSFVRISRLSENDKDLSIILRPQLDVMVRKQNGSIKPNRAEKAMLAFLTAQLKKNTKRTIRQLSDFIRIVRPGTVIRWHRELVRDCLKNRIIVQNDWSQPIGAT